MRLATYLTNRLIADAIISHEDEEIIKYGLESMISNLLGISITLIIGAILEYLAESFILWFLFFPLRKNAGGYHADTRGKCLIISVLMLVITFFVDSLIKRITILYIIVAICFFAFIFAVAPVENHNKLLDLCEKREYRKRTRIILLGEEMLFLVALVFRWEILASARVTYYFELVNTGTQVTHFSSSVNNKTILSNPWTLKVTSITCEGPYGIRFAPAKYYSSNNVSICSQSGVWRKSTGYGTTAYASGDAALQTYCLGARQDDSYKDSFESGGWWNADKVSDL